MKTDITVILDRSGSMKSCQEEAISGLNDFIAKQKEVDADTNFSLVQFDTQYETIHNCIDIKEVPKIELEPRGMTALLDAVGKTINETGTRLKKMPKALRPNKVLMIIVTDGQENASVEYNHKTVDSMIKHQKDKYSWDFIYIGASIANADRNTHLDYAKSIGINNFMSTACPTSAEGWNKIYSHLSAQTIAYRTVEDSQISMHK